VLYLCNFTHTSTLVSIAYHDHYQLLTTVIMISCFTTDLRNVLYRRSLSGYDDILDSGL